jgi:histidyl-tRNA synthetase
MSKGPQRVRGTQDIFGEEADRFQAVVSAFDRVRRLYAFQRVEVPVFEATEVFARSIGETTDIVSKEMYTFPDRGGDSLTLRPEFTAGLCRAYVSNGWQQHAPLKLATHGPVFRYERPQKGRFRQFHQLDAEIIGTDSPQADVELLVMADQLLHELGIHEGVTLQLNTLGDAETREAWRAALVAHFEAHRGELSEESLVRLDKNPMRILDSKDPRDRPVADSAPGIDDYMSSAAGEFFAAVTAGLDAAGVKWERNERLVRGLDYYRHTAFEFVTDRLGAQGTVLAGGRYDGLIESLGGPPTPAVGWAAGIERLAMMIEAVQQENRAVTIIPEAASAQATALRIISVLRRAGIPSDIAFSGNAKRRFELAARAKSSGRVVVTADRTEADGTRNIGISIRANQEHEAGDPLVEAILDALRPEFPISSHMNKPTGSQFDAVIRHPL